MLKDTASAMEEDDFFGVNYASKQPIPEHILPRSALSKAKASEKMADVGYIDATFFLGLTESSAAQSLRGFTSEKSHRESQEVVDDFFTESMQRINNSAGFFEPQMSVKQFEQEIVEAQAVHHDDGIKAILKLVDPVWKYNSDELIEMLANRVIYESEDVIAFDKPYQMAYSGAPKDQAQMDRLLVGLKKRVAVNADRLHLVSSLDKSCSGVIVFAKNREKQVSLKKLIAEGHALFRFRALVKSIPEEPRTRINIALIKVLKDQDSKLCPLSGMAGPREKLYHLETDCQLVNENKRAHVSLIDAFSKQGITNVIRSHLYYGLNCPIVGDRKYIKREKEYASTFAQLPRFSDEALRLLHIRRRGDVRQLPLFIHLAELHLPLSTGGKFSIVRAEMPKVFNYVLKNLKLFKK